MNLILFDDLPFSVSDGEQNTIALLASSKLKLHHDIQLQWEKMLCMLEITKTNLILYIYLHISIFTPIFTYTYTANS